jgi:hypothetical protein
MKRAFFFTLDSMFAVAILVVALTVISFELNTPKNTYWLPQIGNTFMTSLDKMGVFYNVFGQSDAQAQTTLVNYLNNLPPHVSASMTIRIYSGASDVFTLQRTIQASRGTPNTDQQTYVRRLFSDPSTNKFGIAEAVFSYG